MAGAEGLEPSARGFGGEKVRGEKSFVYWVSWAFDGSRHKLCHKTVDKIGTNSKTENAFSDSLFLVVKPNEYRSRTLQYKIDVK